MEVRVQRFSRGARSTSTSRTAGSASSRGSWPITAREWLITSGGEWLADFVPQMRLTFDVTAEASSHDGVRFKGGVGGDVLLPINQRIPLVIGWVRIEAVHLRAVLGSEDGELSFGSRPAPT